jgi:8-hydroxy-5-deazaflavin:NADPH oxidoreductase
MRIGIVGTGHIGSTVARRLSGDGHEVKIANSRGPHTLQDLAAETGATAVTAADAVHGVQVIVLSVPLGRMLPLRELLADVPDGVVVIDTSNYYPSRDGQIPELDRGEVEGLWVARQLGMPIIKAWNAVLAGSFAEKGRPPGQATRIVLPVAGDDPVAKRLAMELVEATGFDAYDAGLLEESWRIQPGNPGFCADLDLEQLRRALSQADRARAPRRRDLGIKAIAALGDHDNADVLHLYRALTKSPGIRS